MARLQPLHTPSPHRQDAHLPTSRTEPLPLGNNPQNRVLAVSVALQITAVAEEHLAMGKTDGRREGMIKEQPEWQKEQTDSSPVHSHCLCDSSYIRP